MSRNYLLIVEGKVTEKKSLKLFLKNAILKLYLVIELICA